MTKIGTEGTEDGKRVRERQMAPASRSELIRNKSFQPLRAHAFFHIYNNSVCLCINESYDDIALFFKRADSEIYIFIWI